MKVAIYARVSTANNGQAWLAGCRMLRGYQRLEGRRPELNRLMADAHKRKFAVVAVWEFDRFARSVSHLLRALETLNALGIAFASLTVVPDARRIAALREQGLSWAKDRRAPGHWRGDSLPSCARTRQNLLFQAARNSLRGSDQLTRIPSGRKKCFLRVRSGGAGIQRRSDRLAWGKIGYSLAVNGEGSLYAPSTSAKS
jgi:hypothetical protein